MLLTAALVAGCSHSEQLEASDDESPLTTDPPPVAGAQRLAGMMGTAPITDVTERFHRRLLGVDPELDETAGAAAAYDAAIVVGLATELARTDAPSKLATEIVGVTGKGRKCYDYEGCRILMDSGEAIDFDGQSGAILLQENGDPGEASFAVLRMTEAGSVERLSVRSAVAELDDEVQPPVVNPLAGPPADGHLTIGLVLPSTGPDAGTARAQRAGVKLAVEEMNAYGGALGEPVVLLEGDAGLPGSAVAEATVTDQLARGVDVIVSPPSSDATAAILPQVTGAGVVVVSATATAKDLGADDRGLFFRFAPSDALQGRTLADVVTSEGLLDVTVIAERGDGEALIPDLFTGLAVAGGSITSTLLFDGGAAVPQDLVSSIRGSTGEAWVFLGSNEAVAPLLRALLAAGSGPSSPRWFASNLSPQLGA